MKSESTALTERKDFSSLSAVHADLERRIDALISPEQGGSQDGALTEILMYCETFSQETKSTSPKIAAGIADLGASLQTYMAQRRQGYFKICTEMALLRGAIETKKLALREGAGITVVERFRAKEVAVVWRRTVDARKRGRFA
jgi:hypothetical protein